jgi:predicted RNA-binding Zn-ribbon protein involved in translation (DUF1610 family)
VSHPGDFTDKVTFRLCPNCGERNIVRDDDFTRALCEAPCRRSGTSFGAPADN